MTYTEYYTSKDAIRASDPITREAYELALTMYEPHWGWKDNLYSLTEERLPIVYAFNIAESLKKTILDSVNHAETIKEVTNLLHLFKKNEFPAISWAYQQNTILGILYYLLASVSSITDSDLECLEGNALLTYGLKNPKGMIYFNVFKDAVVRKRELESSITQTNKQEVKEDLMTAQLIFNQIFRDGLDMEKISTALQVLLDKEIRKGVLLFSQQRHWYVVYQWFLEIGFIEKMRTAKAFREWAMAMFGKKGYSTENDFSEAKKIYNGNPTGWKPVVDHTDFTDIRDYLAREFSKEKRSEYLIKNRYIHWELPKK